MGFSRQEYRSRLPCPPQGIFPNQVLNPGLPHCRQILYQLSYQGSQLFVYYRAPERDVWEHSVNCKVLCNASCSLSYLFKAAAKGPPPPHISAFLLQGPACREGLLSPLSQLRTGELSALGPLLRLWPHLTAQIRAAGDWQKGTEAPYFVRW